MGQLNSTRTAPPRQRKHGPAGAVVAAEASSEVPFSFPRRVRVLLLLRAFVQAKPLQKRPAAADADAAADAAKISTTAAATAATAASAPT
jgi:hypothetical protein